MIALAWLLIFLGLLLLLISHDMRKKSRQVCLLPGPKGLPLIGNLHQMDQKKPHKTITEWAKQYGPVYQIFFGRKRVVVANDFDSIYEVLVCKSADFAGRPESFRMSYQQQNTGFAFVDPSPEMHALRKLTFKHLKSVADGMDRIERIMIEIMDVFISRLEDTKGNVIDPRDYIYHATMSMMFLLILGEHFQEGDPEFQQLRDIEDSQSMGLSPGGEGELLDMFPWLRFFGNKTFKLLKHAVDTRHKFWREFMSREQGYGEGQGGVAHKMLCAVQNNEIESEGVKLNDVDVMVSVFNLQVAGATTTTLTLYCFFNILLHNPEVARNIRTDIYKKVGKDHLITLKDRDALQYSQACIFECLRLISSGPLSIPHKALWDTSIQGHFVPKGTVVMTNLWNLHHDNNVWSEPWEFKPERFLDSQGKVILADHPNRKHLMPFSAGYRVCMGENLALSRLFIWINNIIQKFDLLPEDPDNLVTCDPRDFNVGLGIQPLPYKMKFVKLH